ncbi:hypothetical protein [Actinokineospora inagensis]|uniref:hypothetical protein n=1 Tax=Actinokineospora inagensis TaxID=103730 RepID=UPI0004280A69|nr:hypothetical protein [Actinokineospora inagensis]
MRYLAIVERGYRGSVETQFADVLYLVRELNRQLDGLDLSLRGLAVTYAVTADPVPPVVGLDTLPDPRASLRTLLDEGVTVTVTDDDLAAAGLPGDVQLLPGVVRGAARWTDYRAVWFL